MPALYQREATNTPIWPLTPNAAPGSSHVPVPGDWDCWIVNRKNVPVPFDPQPPAPPGVTDVVNAVFGRLAQAFGGDTAALVLRLSQVYGIANTLHIDVPVPQPDFTVHIDIPVPALDASEHIDFSSPPISWSTHVDIPTDELHVDVPGSDLHVDVPASDLHVDFSVGPAHFDTSGHIDVTEHIDVQSPHIDVSNEDGELHADTPSSQLHIDVPASNFAFSQHVDLGHIDVNPFLEGLLQGATNPLALLLGGLLTFVDPIVAVVMEGLLLAGLDVASLVAMIVKIAGAHDTLDVALDTMTAPITIANTPRYRPALLDRDSGVHARYHQPSSGRRFHRYVGRVDRLPRLRARGCRPGSGAAGGYRFWLLANRDPGQDGTEQALLRLRLHPPLPSDQDASWYAAVAFVGHDRGRNWPRSRTVQVRCCSRMAEPTRPHSSGFSTTHLPTGWVSNIPGGRVKQLFATAFSSFQCSHQGLRFPPSEGGAPGRCCERPASAPTVAAAAAPSSAPYDVGPAVVGATLPARPGTSGNWRS